jgi:cyclophilin family peptidyl-prolyl cis-trans isomerase
VDQRATTILIVILMIAGLVAGGGYTYIKSIYSPTPTPAPTVEPDLFADPKAQQAEQQKVLQKQQQQEQLQNSLKQMQYGQKQPGEQMNPPQPQQNTQQVQGRKAYSQFPGVYSPDDLKNKKAIIETDKGVIEFEIFPDSPKAASNFMFLTLEGFYNGLKFHRVVPGFVIQGGDPLGNGSGGPGYQFEDEPVTLKYDKGIVAMANAGPNTNGSQFFIMLEDNPSLPPSYTIFGRVIKGQEVVSQIKVGDVMKEVTIAPLK